MAENTRREEELRARLTPEQYEVTQNKATEPPFSGNLLYNKEDGIYRCVVCGEPGERHHEDYEQPLVIVWYCRRHHIERHVVLYGSWGSGLSR